MDLMANFYHVIALTYCVISVCIFCFLLIVKYMTSQIEQKYQEKFLSQDEDWRLNRKRLLIFGFLVAISILLLLSSASSANNDVNKSILRFLGEAIGSYRTSLVSFILFSIFSIFIDLLDRFPTIYKLIVCIFTSTYLHLIISAVRKPATAQQFRSSK